MSHSALLRASGQHGGENFRLDALLAGDAAASGVPHAALLVEFGEAVLARDEPRQRISREALRREMGEASLADAAAIVASFNAVVIIADATGIPLEEEKAQRTADLRRELDLDRLRNR